MGLAAAPEKTLTLDHQARIKHLEELLERQALSYLQAHKKHSGGKLSPSCFISYAWRIAHHKLWVKGSGYWIPTKGLLKQALIIIKRDYDKNYPATAIILTHFGRVYAALQNSEQR